MGKRYYSLLVRDDSYTAPWAGWTIEFGDYAKECVVSEQMETAERVGRKNTAVVVSGDTQDAIDAAVAAFVEKRKAR